MNQNRVNMMFLSISLILSMPALSQPFCNLLYYVGKQAEFVFFMENFKINSLINSFFLIIIIIIDRVLFLFSFFNF